MVRVEPEEPAAPSEPAPRGRAVARRAMHIAVSLAVLYWWFPERVVEIGATRDQLVVGATAAVVALEAVRLRRGRLVFPMREYERRQVGGHVWLVVGCAVAVLFFEQRFAMVAILGTTLVDPVLGELRSRGLGRIAPAVGFGAWVTQALACATLVPLDTPLALILLGGVVAVAAEALEVPRVDDNFTMNLAPLVAMSAASWLAAGFL
jgi:dolichol kinase